MMVYHGNGQERWMQSAHGWPGSLSFFDALLGTLLKWPGLLNPPPAALWGLWKSA